MRFKPRFFVIIAIILVLILVGATSCSSKKESNKPSKAQSSSVSGVKPDAEPEKDKGEEKEEAPAEPEVPEEPQQVRPTTKTPADAYPLNKPDDDYLVLANKTHKMTEDYYPDDMVTVTTVVSGVGTDETKKLRKVAADALEELIAGAKADGWQIAMRTGFRSYSYQKSLFASYANKNGEAAANRYSAKAGESEHQTGLCCDVSSPSVNWSLSYSYGETDEGKWLADNAHRYGFIIRYKQDKEDVTGYVYEPWHIRYVGTEAAAIIYEEDITLEEYLEILN